MQLIKLYFALDCSTDSSKLQFDSKDILKPFKKQLSYLLLL